MRESIVGSLNVINLPIVQPAPISGGVEYDSSKLNQTRDEVFEEPECGNPSRGANGRVPSSSRRGSFS